MVKSNRFIFLSIVLIVFVADFFSKLIIDNNLLLEQKVLVLDGILSFEKVYNTGGAFSILQNSTIFLSIISFLTIGIIFFIIFYRKLEMSVTDFIGLAFVCGGASGNFIDRVTLGHVIDFIQLEFINFPIFNFADIFINIGVIILLYSIIFDKNGKQNYIM